MLAGFLVLCRENFAVDNIVVVKTREVLLWRDLRALWKSKSTRLLLHKLVCVVVLLRTKEIKNQRIYLRWVVLRARALTTAYRLDWVCLHLLTAFACFDGKLATFGRKSTSGHGPLEPFAGQS
jgi:hypothetical protein